MKTPIAVFSYNRPQHLRQLISSLLNCARLDECQVYIFCDGAKKSEHEEAVRESRRVVREFAPQLYNVIVVEREHNLGLARSIVSGVTDLCEQYGRVIVLEDDFILHPFFIEFMLQSLDRYADDERVAQVAGFTFPIDMPAKPDAFFLPLTTSWGWATWQRAWKLFSWETESALKILDSDPKICAQFDLDGLYLFSDMLRLAAEGKVDSWAIRWYWRTYVANKLTLYPRSSLVWQNGFDPSATNTTSAGLEPQPPLDEFMRKQWCSPLLYSDKVREETAAFEKLKKFLRHRSSHSLRVHPKELLKRFLSRLTG